MSAIDSMVKSLLRAMDIDPVEVEKMVTGRVKIFEQNIELLNSTLISQEKRLSNLEVNLKAMMEFHGLTYTAKEETNANNGTARTAVQSNVPALPSPTNIAQ